MMPSNGYDVAVAEKDGNVDVERKKQGGTRKEEQKNEGGSENKTRFRSEDA